MSPFRSVAQPRPHEIESRDSHGINPRLTPLAPTLLIPYRIVLLGRNFKWARE
jgi:hypothetical protein